ncbi:flavin reductase family protein [Microbacterium sp. PI-1]|uniref:flavin reductase family protein n=1 Tax=unclassified Microbacterium TaxID=2609290 RepID=UPI00103A3402|nr:MULTISPECIES: flavin reductase family protein [unclassified Microbacterium]QEA27393.1 flavin reductase family protein [Microbacterium sp. CBA3102]TCJ23815.1 flavin reductase family protein [Microbacterium sp. PI-1]
MNSTLAIEPSVFYFGTPVALLTTAKAGDETANITPISSAWALGDTYVLGLSNGGKAMRNLRDNGELVINLPDARLCESVERIADTTGVADVPAPKRDKYRFEPDKWTLGGFTPRPSGIVGPPRIAECPVQMEARVTNLTPLDEEGDATIVHAKVLRTHVHQALAVPGTSYVDVDAWKPMYYTFRHYFAQGERVGVNFRAER